jgi:predicted Zn-dependent peptidase
MKQILAFFFLVGLGAFTLPVSGEDQPAARVELPAYKTVKLENGLTLFLLERHQLPLVNFHWVLKSGGSIGDPPGHEGLASLTASLLRKGTTTRTADQISEALDFVGASFGAGAGQETTSGSAEFVAKDLNLALDLLSDMLMHPSFPADELSKLIQQEIDGIKEAKDVPGHVIGRYYNGLLFGSHLYSRPVSGTEASLPKITRDDVTGFYDSHYLPNETLLAVVGDFSASDLESKLRAKLGTWKRKPIALPELKAPTKIEGKRALLVEKPDATQTFFRFGNIGLARTNRDWVSVEVVNTLFGGRFTSMINTELRIESGLTYGASSVFTANQLPGAFAIASFTPNDTSERAITMALDVLRKLHDKGITAEQLKSAKAYIKGQFGPSLETNDQLANKICELEFYGLGSQEISTLFARIDAMSLADAKRIIETYYPKDDLAFVLIGQAAVVEPVAKKLGLAITKKAITEPGF